ncbi:hypothetical protein LINGRAHAP2_LOCUS2227, partial [Linum grandiflorum]
MKVGARVFSNTSSPREETLVGWKAEQGDMITINTDGSVMQTNSNAAAGGIIRDVYGNTLG